MIEVQSIYKSYGALPVLEGISTRFSPGTISTVLGSNGAGKSTLLNIMGRLLPLDRGSILLKGQDISRIPVKELARTMAILKQNTQVQARLTVRELVEFGRFPHSQGRVTPRDSHAIDHALEFTALEDIQGRLIQELSGGQRQRAFIAMVIAQESPLILLDEPLNSLDLRHGVQILELLQRLRDEQGKTIIMVLHDLNLALHFSDHILALRQGAVSFEGHPEDFARNDRLQPVFGLEFDFLPYKRRTLCLHY